MAMLVSCAAGGKLLSATTANMAGALKDFCVSHGISTVETKRADSLYSLADQRIKRGQKGEAYDMLDRAVIYYRLALSKQELDLAERRLEDTREQARIQEEQLSEYREVVRELKGGAQ